MTLAWALAQFVFWCILFVGFCVLVAVVVLAPPVLAARWLWKRTMA